MIVKSKRNTNGIPAHTSVKQSIAFFYLKNISHIQSRTSRREREFLSPNLMLRDKTENNFLQSQASRRDRDLFFSISDYETRSRIFLSNSQFLRRERESIYCYLSQINYIFSNFFTQKFGDIFLLDPGVGATRLALCFST